MENDKSLGDILHEATKNTPPRMEYGRRIRVEYIGNHKIYAIGALRKWTQLTLKSAKEAIEWPGGIVLASVVYASIVESYLSNGMSVGCHSSDWREIVERPDPIEL